MERKLCRPGWAKGRKEHYARYWCWTKGCHSVKISREKLELHFVHVLGSLEPTAQYWRNYLTLPAESGLCGKSKSPRMPRP